MNKKDSIEKINVLYINPSSRMSGAEFSLLLLMEKLDRKRFNPILVLPGDGPFLARAENSNVETITLPSIIRFGEGYKFSKLPKIMRAVSGLINIIKKRNIKIVHSNSPRTAYIGGLSARLAMVNSITHVRDIYLSPFQSSIKAKLLSFLSDVIIAVSNATAESIIKVTPSLERKVRVIYNGIDIEKIEKMKLKNLRKEIGFEENAPIIGMIGIIHPAKGQGILIKATSIIVNEIPSVKVLIVGDVFVEEDRNYKDELIKLCMDLNLERNVIFTGFINEIFDVINTVDIIVHAPVYPEPFPRILLEASALCKPIVATNVGGIHEIVEDGVSGILIEPSNPEALANAILSLLKNKRLTEAISLNARKKVEKDFTLEKHVKSIMDIYNELIFGKS